jgi:hypothetical protein
MFKRHLSSLHYGWSVSALSLFSYACAGEEVDVGEISRDLASAESRCQLATLVQGSVLIENQQQLDQLTGCEVIEGNLHVRPFDGADFRPLAALREVGGALELGRMTALDMLELPLEIQEDIDAIFAREQAIIDSGWLASLAGFENLERAGSLTLTGVSAPDLEAFSKLSALTNGAVLQIGPCSGLLALTGLERLRGVVNLSLTCESLESLAGPSFAARMMDVYITGSNLTDLGALDLESVNELRIEYTAIESLDALSGLTRANHIDVWGNSALTDVDAFDALAFGGYIRFGINPLLERLPEFTSLYELSSFIVTSNESLTNFPSFPNVGPLNGASDLSELDPSDALRLRPDVIEVANNPAIEQIVIPAGWLAASYVTLGGNASLTSIDLSNLHAIDRLGIALNPLLESVTVGLLETADDLFVFENPLLPLDTFDSVQSYSRIVQSGPLEPREL